MSIGWYPHGLEISAVEAAWGKVAQDIRSNDSD
jgi:hypothetical protein